MLIYAIDDEKIALSELVEAVRLAVPEGEIKQFTNANDALAKIKVDGESPDIVFADF